MNLYPEYYMQRDFADFEELCEVTEFWNLELTKLDNSSSHCTLSQIADDRFILSRSFFGCRFRQVGEAPEDMITLAISAGPGADYLWRSRKISHGSLLVFPRSRELNSVSGPNFDMYTLSLRESDLDLYALKLGVEGFTESLYAAEILQPDPILLQSFRDLLGQVMQSILGAGGADSSHYVYQLVRHVFDIAVDSPGSKVGTRISDSRLRIIRESESLIHSRLNGSLLVRDLCTELSVSQRTLEYAFKEYFGINPKAHINRVKLNAVHRKLRLEQTTIRGVSDVANEFGFWHIGQFSSDYRKLFGELPSHTLGLKQTGTG